MQTLNLKSTSLFELQKWIRWILVDPRGVSEALKNPQPKDTTHPDRYTEPNVKMRGLIENSGQSDLEKRLSIYAEGYFSRILEVIEGDFKATTRILGEDEFSRLVAEYLKDYPSKETNIGEIAKHLPKFAQTYDFFSELPYLKELITLEWSIVESFYAKESTNFDLNNLIKISDSEWPLVTFEFDSSVKLHEFNWAVDSLWQARESDPFKPVLEKLSKSFILLYRSDNDVKVKNISNLEFRVLTLLKSGLTLGEVTGQIDLQENLEKNLSGWFSEWTSARLFNNIKIKKEEI
jgi:hypothetical protein